MEQYNSSPTYNSAEQKQQYREYFAAAAALRYESDKRQIGAMLFATGLCAVIQPLTTIATMIDPGAIPGSQGLTDVNEVPFWSFLGNIIICIIGFLAMACGYFAVIHDQGNIVFTGLMIVLIQVAFIPYVTGMVDMAKKANLPAEENVFIPLGYNPTDQDVTFIGVLGVLLIFAYGFAFIGSIAFMLFSLYTFQAGRPERRNGNYYAGRLGLYSFFLGLAGICQLMLGFYISSNFGQGILNEYGPISVAFIHVYFPYMTTIVGLMQLLNGLWGWGRSLDVAHWGINDTSYAISIFVNWIMVLALQIITQTGYASPGSGELAQHAPSMAAMTFGILIMPAYLDQKCRSMPSELPENYYFSGRPTDDRWCDEDYKD